MLRIVSGITVLSLSACLTSISDVSTNSGGAGGNDDASAGGNGGADDASAGGNGGAAAGGTSGSNTGGTAGSSNGGSAGTVQDAASDGAAGGNAGPSGLVGYWPLDDNGGNVAKDQIGSAHGSVPAVVTWSNDSVSGASLRFQEGAPLEINDWSGSKFPTKGCVSLWLKPKLQGTVAKNRGILDNWDSTRNHLFIRRSNLDPDPPSVQAAFSRVGTPYVGAAIDPLKEGSWQFLALSWDIAAGTAFLYLDGKVTVMKLAPDSTTWTPKEQRFHFGDDFIGQIDEIRLYNRYLAQNEVAQIEKL